MVDSKFQIKQEKIDVDSLKHEDASSGFDFEIHPKIKEEIFETDEKLTDRTFVNVFENVKVELNESDEELNLKENLKIHIESVHEGSTDHISAQFVIIVL